MTLLVQGKFTTSKSKYFDEPISSIMPLMCFTDIKVTNSLLKELINILPDRGDGLKITSDVSGYCYPKD